MKAHPLSGYLVSEDGVIVNPKTGYQLKPTLSPAGYYKIGNYICTSGMVHTAVFETYCQLVPKGMQINHKDGNKTNNHISNLELVSPKENAIHAHLIGLASGNPGESNSMAKLTELQVKEIYKRLLDLECNECIGKQYNIHPRYVSLIRTGKRWKYLNPMRFPSSNKWKCSCCTATTIETTE